MDNYEVVRLPPHSEEAEQAVLGCVLIDANVYENLPITLKPEVFYRVQHKWIFEAMVALMQEGMPIDMLTLQEKLTVKNRLDDIGGIGYIASLINIVPTSINANHYAATVIGHHTSRQLIAAASEVVNVAYEDIPADEKIVRFTEIYHKASTNGSAKNDGPQHIRDIAIEHIQQVEARDEETDNGINTGFYDLDRILRGIKEGRFYLLGARPGMGKTALLAAIAKNVAKSKKVGIISTEMDKLQLFVRLIASHLGLDTRDIDSMHMGSPRIEDYMTAVGQLSELGIYIESCSNITAADFTRRATRMKVLYDIDFLMMDYLQLIEADNRNGSSESQIADISRSMVGLTKRDRLDIPIMAAAQLNRQVENRQIKRPIKSDLKGSGSLEADADVIMLLYRDEYYNPDTSDRPNIAEIIVDKNRHGPTGVVDTFFETRSTSFKNLHTIEIPLPNLSGSATHIAFSSQAYGD